MTTASPAPTGNTDPGLRDGPTVDDLELVRRVRAGDLSAFELIMRRHNRRLYRAAYGVVGNAAEAEDVVQEAYLRAYAGLDRFVGPHGFAAWITRIAVNEALGRVRRRGRVVSFADYADPAAGEGSGPDPLETYPTTDPGPERMAANAELRHLLERAIAALPGEFRAVFMLREVEGLSVAETAESLSLREQTVKTRLHRAKRELRRALGGELEAVMPSLYEFAGRRCDRVVHSVLERLRARPPDR